VGAIDASIREAAETLNSGAARNPAITGGLGGMNPIAFMIIAALATLPIAALSWIAVEKPAMSLKSRLTRKRSAPAGAHQPVQTVSG
jgi:peptidoglycan/LPS O-acetylase OafA/YrhL